MVSWELMTIVIILLGVCTGLFTTTESAAIACVYALFVTLFIYKSIKVKDIWRIAKRSLGTLAMILRYHCAGKCVLLPYEPYAGSCKDYTAVVNCF